MARWAKGSHFLLTDISRSSFFGDGAARGSMGACFLPISIPPQYTNQTKTVTLHVSVDVVLAGVPLLISKKTMVCAQGELDFTTSILPIEAHVTIQLTNLPSGNLSLPGTFVPLSSEVAISNSPDQRQQSQEPAQTDLELYHFLKDRGLTAISDEDLPIAHLRIKHIFRPSEFPPADSFGPSPTDDEVEWQRQTNNSIRRIFTPRVVSWHTSVSSSTMIMAASDWRQKQSTHTQLSPSLLLRPLVLTDCCTLIGAILRIPPRHPDNCAKLILNQLRDLRRLLDLSFADYTCTLCDVETKHAGPLGISHTSRLQVCSRSPL